MSASRLDVGEDGAQDHAADGEDDERPERLEGFAQQRDRAGREEGRTEKREETEGGGDSVDEPVEPDHLAVAEEIADEGVIGRRDQEEGEIFEIVFARFRESGEIVPDEIADEEDAQRRGGAERGENEMAARIARPPADGDGGARGEEQHQRQRGRKGAGAALHGFHLLQEADLRHVDDAALLVDVVGEMNDEAEFAQIVRQRDDGGGRVHGNHVLGRRRIAVAVEKGQLEFAVTSLRDGMNVVDGARGAHGEGEELRGVGKNDIAAIGGDAVAGRDVGGERGAPDVGQRDGAGIEAGKRQTAAAGKARLGDQRVAVDGPAVAERERLAMREIFRTGQRRGDGMGAGKRLAMRRGGRRRHRPQHKQGGHEECLPRFPRSPTHRKTRLLRISVGEFC